MRVLNIKLDHFRNYGLLDVSLHPGTNLFYGQNAQGKTNILESIFLCGTTRSHRGSKDKEMISFGQEESHIRMEVEKKQIDYRIDMHLKKNKAKGIAVNMVPVRRAGEMVGICSFVFFSPEDLGIIKNGPAERRRFMDMELCQLGNLYLRNLSDYNRTLQQRNRLLKDLSFRSDYMPTLDVWDEKLCEFGEKIIRQRESFVVKLNDRIGRIHAALTGQKEELKVSYEGNISAEQMREKVERGRDRDIQMGATMTGPHRDDLLLTANGIDLRRFGSQGQQRTAALSLKLAEIELVREMTADPPVLLLDDVLSELDQDRQRFLMDSIRGVQTLITCTGIEDFRKHGFQIDRLFFVKEGTVREISPEEEMGLEVEETDGRSQ